MLRKQDFSQATCKIFSGDISLQKTTEKQLKKEAETLAKKLLLRELRGAKTKSERLRELADAVGKDTLKSVIEAMSLRDATAAVKRCDPGAHELEDPKQVTLTERLKAIAAGAELSPPPTKRRSTKLKEKSSSPKPTFEALSLEGRRKR